jgi:hypothetical protein
VGTHATSGIEERRRTLGKTAERQSPVMPHCRAEGPQTLPSRRFVECSSEQPWVPLALGIPSRRILWQWSRKQRVRATSKVENRWLLILRLDALSIDRYLS